MARGSRLLEEPRSVRERWADEILDRLSPIMGVLGIVFVLLVLGEQLARPGPLSVAMAVLSWMLWAVFAVEFVARLVVTPTPARSCGAIGGRSFFWCCRSCGCCACCGSHG